MAYEHRKPRHDWRSKLTDGEVAIVHALEQEIKDATARKAEAVARLGPIRNRAIQRARYEADQSTPQKETTSAR